MIGGMSRYLLIGLDGAEPSLLGPWMDDGRLPNLARIRDAGSFLPCESTTPPATFPAWTTCVTGVNPGRHGIFDFTEQVEGAYRLRFVNSTYRRAPALWNILSEADKRVCVLGVPGTYPPENVNGVLVSGFDSPVCQRIDPSFVYPAEAYPLVKGWPFADFQESAIGPGWHDMALGKLMDGIERKEQIACDLLARERYDFAMVVFGESDTVSHHFWMFHDPDSPRHRPGHETAIRDIYERLDVAVGNLMEAMGDDCVVGVVSDHGFGGAGTGVVHLNNWLAERGYLRCGDEGGESLLKRAGMGLVPPGLRGALFRKLGPLVNRAESRSRFGGIDWAGTRAWSEELDYFPSVRVNLEGREPAGSVSESEYYSFIKWLCDELMAWEVVERAWPRGELYEGPYVGSAPDIVLRLALEDGYSYSCLRARGGPAVERIEPGDFVGGKERGMNGTHRPVGVFLSSAAVDNERCSLLDVAPTVLSCMGVAGPAMDGRGMTGEPVTGEVDYRRKPAAYTAEEEAVLEERLRGLGYFE